MKTDLDTVIGDLSSFLSEMRQPTTTTATSKSRKTKATTEQRNRSEPMSREIITVVMSNLGFGATTADIADKLGEAVDVASNSIVESEEVSRSISTFFRDIANRIDDQRSLVAEAVRISSMDYESDDEDDEDEDAFDDGIDIDVQDDDEFED